MTPTSPDRPLPWWASPAGINLGFLIPMLLLVTYVGHSNFAGLTLRGVWFLTGPYVSLGIGILVVTALCSWIGAQITPRAVSAHGPQDEGWRRAALLVGSIALLAYLYFFRSILFDPVLLWRTLTGAYRPDRTNLEITAGITSFENVAPVFFSIYAYQAIGRRIPVGALMHGLCAALIGLTALRVYAWSERLALIEAVLPIGLAGAVRLGVARGRAVRALTWAGPFFAIPLLLLYFALAESVRSWAADLYHDRTGFWEFAAGRMASYYITSLNNGAGLLQTVHWPTFQFNYTLTWLYKLPFFGDALAAYLNSGANRQIDPLEGFLGKYGDPEFNNPSGLFAVICDLGLPLGIAYFGAIGALGGLSFRAYRAGRLAGVLFYPMFFLAFLEAFRYPYLGTQRAFTWTLGIGLAWIVGRAQRDRAFEPQRRDAPEIG